METPLEKDSKSVAITGLSCRFPGDGENVDSFWESICKARSAWSEVPKDRFNVDAFWSPSGNRNTSITRGAHFIKQDISAFDANFFNIPKAEADAMDPQHRIMIEVTYEALENAGLPLHQLAGTRTGVFMGQWTSDYREMLFRDPESAPLYTASGSSKTSLANRISWLLDLKGPSFTMDTACSSSLLAMHLACQSLRCGESDIAIVGGVNILLNPEMFMYMSNQGFLSPDGKCKSFDESGDGYGRGEGFAAIILKRVDDAITLSDPIRAVIRGTASNQDGHTRGFFLPSADAQAALIAETYQGAGLDYGDTHYVEAHGTGTQAGDTHETEALSRTISKSHSAEKKLLIGSVKSNIGHLEACAGLAAIIKAVCILESGIIPPSINFEKGNPKIKFDEWNLKVQTELTAWPTQSLRRISTNSFGYGGTNSHAILDDALHYLENRGIQGNHYTKTSNRLNGVYTNGEHTNGTRVIAKPSFDSVLRRHGSRLFVISAQDKAGLKRVKSTLSEFLKKKDGEIKHRSREEEKFLADLAHSLCIRRSLLHWKTYAIASSLKDLCQTLIDDQSTALVSRSSRSPKIGFIFTGQGAQWARMGAELIEYKVFRESVQAADRYLREHLNCTWSIVEELQKSKETSRLHLAVCSQTLCTVLQVALVELLRTWNISPVAVAGHSAGEMAAAYCLGAIRREDAWKVAYWRGVLSSGLKNIAPEISGAMMAVGLSPKAAKLWISKTTKGEVMVACVNAPTSVTLSGDKSGIDELADLLKEAGIFARKLQVDTAYHSPHMQILASDCLKAIADIKTLTASGTCSLHSSVTGFKIEPSELGPAYWVRNMTSPVQFASAVHDLLRPMKNGCRSIENAVDVLIEIGPHCALQGPTTQTLKANGITNIPYMSALVRNQDAINSTLNLVGALTAQGFSVDISNANNDGENPSYTPKPLVDLPIYPWNHSQKYWIESRIGKEYRLREHPRLSLLGAPVPSMTAGESTWRGFLRLSEEPWVADHRIHESILYPAAGFLAMAMEGAVQITDKARKIASFRLRDIQFIAAAVVTEQSDLEFTLQLRPHITGTRGNTSTWLEFIVSSSGDGANLQKNCSGLLIIDYEPESSFPIIQEKDMEDAQSKAKYNDAAMQCDIIVNSDKFYADLKAIGLNYGPTFANLAMIRRRDGQACGVVEIPNIPTTVTDKHHGRPHIIHPGTLDAIFHLAFAALGGQKQPKSAMVPKSIDEVIVSTNISYESGSRLTGYSNSEKRGYTELRADIMMLDEHKNAPVIRISGFCCNEIGGGNTGQIEAKKICSKLTWRPAMELISLNEQRSIIENLGKIKMTNAVELVIEQENISASKYFTDASSLGDKASLQTIFLETQSVNAILSKLTEFLKLIHHTNPQVSVLEVHMGSGPMLLLPERASLHPLLMTGEYTITQSDGTSNSRVDKLVTSFQGNVKRRVLKIDENLEVQEMHDRQFDVIVCFDISRTAQNLDASIANFKKLLKPGGAACFIEAVNPGPRLSMVGCSKSRPGEVEHFLHRLGIKRNYKFVDFEEKEFPELSLTIGNVEFAPVYTQDRDYVLITPPTLSQESEAVVAELTTSLKNLSFKATNFAWGSDIAALEGKHCVALLELDNSIFMDLDERDFESVRKIILGATSTFWVVGHGDPSAAMISGLARVVRNEMPSVSFQTFHYNQDSQVSSEKVGELISRIISSSASDNEFMVKNGVVNVCRVEEDVALNDEIESLLPQSGHKVNKLALGQAIGPQKLCVLKPGLLDSLSFEVDELPLADLSEDMVEIKVKATSLHSREVLSALGQIPDIFLGFGAAGIVIQVGSSVSKFKIGDRVSMIGRGAHRTVHRSRSQYCELIPTNMSFEEASTVPSAHATAWYGLIKLARIKKGQSILIHAAAGGIGQAAIQIAKHFELVIYAIVDSEIKRNLVRDEYHIPDDHILDSQDLNFAKGIKRMTGGRGVDVILNSSTGETLRETWYCIAPFGYFLEIGIKDILGNTELDMKPFLQDATFSFFDLSHISEGAVETMAEIIAGTWDFQHRGIGRPISPITAHPISDVAQAFRLIQTDKHMGEVTLTWSDESVVPVVQRNRANSLQLDPNAAYLLVGGLGGLGRSLSTMLVELGARKLCFISRSGDSSPQARLLIQDLTNNKVQIRVYVCDVADEKAVTTAVSRCSQELGTIKGVFQCAMILRDALFTNITYREWNESTRPKVQGSWNLHKQLKDVEFFVILSSFAAVIGNRGQSNYAVAGAYEDSLSHYRQALGLHSVTVDLGIMRDIGVLAEKGMVESFREWEEPYGIRAIEFHALMKQAMLGDISRDIAPQILTGIATAGSAVQAGIVLPFYLEDPRFSIMRATNPGEKRADGGGLLSTETLIAKATSLQEASRVVEEALAHRVAQILQTSISEIDTSRFLHSYGIDSLVAIEIVNWAFKEIKSKITVFDVMAGIPMTTTSTKIAARSAYLPREYQSLTHG